MKTTTLTGKILLLGASLVFGATTSAVADPMVIKYDRYSGAPTIEGAKPGTEDPTSADPGASNYSASAFFRQAVTEQTAALGADEVVLASEDEFKRLFPDCELGAMPPFGNLYDMGVYVAGELTEDEEIAFNAGSHTELVRMAYKDYANLVTPRVVSLT